MDAILLPMVSSRVNVELFRHDFELLTMQLDGSYSAD